MNNYDINIKRHLPQQLCWFHFLCTRKRMDALWLYCRYKIWIN